MSGGWMNGPPGSVGDDDDGDKTGSSSHMQNKLLKNKMIMEQKQRNKRRGDMGMVVANEDRPTSGPRNRRGRDESKPLVPSATRQNDQNYSEHEVVQYVTDLRRTSQHSRTSYDGPMSGGYQLSNPDNTKTTVTVLKVTKGESNDYDNDEEDIPTIDTVNSADNIPKSSKVKTSIKNTSKRSKELTPPDSPITRPKPPQRSKKKTSKKHPPREFVPRLSDEVTDVVPYDETYQDIEEIDTQEAPMRTPSPPPSVAETSGNKSKAKSKRSKRKPVSCYDESNELINL